MKPTIFATAVFVFLLAATAFAQQSSEIVSTTVTQARVNTNVVLSARLINAWTNAADGTLAGRQVDIGVGDQYSFSSTPFFTNNNGQVSRTWRFTRTGRYRITFRFSGASGYLDSRRTVFINIVN